MSRVLFHSLTIPPDNVSTGMLVAEIADGFKELGVDVEMNVHLLSHQQQQASCDFGCQNATDAAGV